MKNKILKIIEAQKNRLDEEIKEWEDVPEQKAYYNGAITILDIITSNIKELNTCHRPSYPETIEEFIKEFQFKDRHETYTNGSDLIQVFRVKEALEHYFKYRVKE